MQKRLKNVLACAFLILMLLLVSGCVQETLSRPEKVEEGRQEHQADPEAEKRRREEEERLARERELEARRKREAALREELGPFFVSLPPLDAADNPRIKAKAIYLTGYTAANEKRLGELLELVEQTELNAVVIDVKNDAGLLTYHSDLEIVREVNSGEDAKIDDLDALLAELKQRDIYPIARIVVFRDPHLPEARPEWAIQKQNGGLWRDYGGFAWVNPYEKNVWDYNIAIAKEAALKGFREIQFDYVRFPENAKRVDREAVFPGSNGRTKAEAIAQFLAYAVEQLAEYNVHLAADVFGVIATSDTDAAGIGQKWEEISPLVDYICPMVYPSHYSAGYFGFSVPDANPGGTVDRALRDAIKRNASLAAPAIIRPWLQGFTATWVKGHIGYGSAEIRAQIDAALALGIDEFMLWNAANRYTAGGLLTPEEAVAHEAAQAAARQEKGLDSLNRTKTEALKDYLGAVKKQSRQELALWQAGAWEQGESGLAGWVESWTSSLAAFRVAESTAAGNYLAAEITLQREDETFSYTEYFPVVTENGLWKIKPPDTFSAALAGQFAPQ